MTKLLEVTRDDVLTAIKEESLTADTWWRQDENCRYCAIGAAIARKGYRSSDVSIVCATVTNFVASRTDSLPAALAGKSWLSAISIKFEQLAYKLADRLEVHETYDSEPYPAPDQLTAQQLEEVKPELSEWILSNVPDGVIYSGVL